MGIADEVRSIRGGAGVSTRRLFTNRRSETAAFAAKVEEVRAARRADPDLNVDLRAARWNLLVFFGAGGIGKTRLSGECERLFAAAPAPAGAEVRRVAVRIDFAEPSARDPELYLFALRAGLARLAPSFPAFDTGLVLYWARRHPGVPMEEFVRNQSLLGGLVDREALAASLRDFVFALLDSAGPVAGGVGRAVSLSWEAIRQARQMRMLERECPWLAGCAAEEDLDELRLHLPLLLAWDLGRLQRRGDVEVLVCLDTFEHVSHGLHRARRGDLEDAIARSVFYLPSVTFLLTTRNRLDWAEERRAATLEYAGPGDWPGLAAPSGPAGRGGDQMRVGELAEGDCESYLAGCLLDGEGRPAIPAPLRVSIAGLSGGLPLYLDVAAQHFRNLLARGAVPAVGDFAQGLPEIVLRLMEDLGDDETDLLRIAALLGVFDRDTLRVALPDLRSSAVERFLERGFVQERGDGLFSVHEMLQTSVRLQDAATTNPWSPAEWQAAQDRLATFWSEQLQDPNSPLWRDRRTQALAFWQLVGLYATTDVHADALASVLMQVQLRGAWATIDAARAQPEVLLTDRGRALLDLLDGMMERQIGTLREAERLLSRALAAPALAGDVRRLVLYYLGETRDVHEGDAAELFREIIASAPVGGDRLAIEARLALAHSLARGGDLVAALELAGELTIDQDDGEFAYRYWELLGVLRWSAGQLDAAAAPFERSRQVALAQDSKLLLALATRHLALASCWTQPAACLALVDRAEALNRDLGMKPGIGQCQMSRATALAGTEPRQAVDALIEEARETFAGAGYLDDALGPLAVAVFAAAVDGDRELAEQRRARLYAAADGRRARHWLAAADAWTGHRDAFDTLTWPQGDEQAWQDWSAILERRRNALVREGG